MRAGMIDMESNTTLVQCYPAHEAVPDGSGPFPAVLVLHDRFGLTAHLRGVVNRLAREGFYALAPNLYALPASFVDTAPDLMKAPGPTFFPYSDEFAAGERAATLSDERADAIVAQALAYVAGRSHARGGGVGALGFSMGGRLALLAACLHSDEVRAAVCFYPEGMASSKSPRRPAALDRVADLRAPVLLFYGALDDEIRSGEREVARTHLAALGKDFQMEVFREAGHDFFCSERNSYRIHASKEAWEETLTFLRRTLGGAQPPSSRPAS